MKSKNSDKTTSDVTDLEASVSRGHVDLFQTSVVANSLTAIGWVGREDPQWDGLSKLCEKWRHKLASAFKRQTKQIVELTKKLETLALADQTIIRLSDELTAERKERAALALKYSELDSDHSRAVAQVEEWRIGYNGAVASIGYYQKELDTIGAMFGAPAYTADDGSVNDSILRAKVKELVALKISEWSAAQVQIKVLEDENASLELAHLEDGARVKSLQDSLDVSRAEGRDYLTALKNQKRLTDRVSDLASAALSWFGVFNWRALREDLKTIKSDTIGNFKW
jgi:hypothetical protein